MIKTLLGQKKATEDLAAKLNTVPTYRRQNVQPQLQLQQRQPRINVDGDSVINVEHQETARNCNARSRPPPLQNLNPGLHLTCQTKTNPLLLSQATEH